MRSTPRLVGPDACARWPFRRCCPWPGADGHDAAAAAAETPDRAAGHHRLEVDRRDRAVERRPVVRVSPRAGRRGRAGRREARHSRRQRSSTFDIGEIPTAGAGAAAAAATPAARAASALEFSEDSKWVAFTTYPTRREAQRLRRQRRPVQSGVTIVNLATGEKREYPRIRRFAFSGDASTWIALQRQPAQAAPGSGAGLRRRRRRTGRGGAAATRSDRPRGTDLILRELASGQELNVGNVTDFAFSKDGTLLALDDRRAGQGRQRRAAPRHEPRHRRGARQRQRQSTSGSRGREKGDGLAVLKGTDDRALRDKRYAVLGFTGFGTGAPQKASYDPASRQDVSRGHDDQPEPRRRSGPTICRRLIFGIHDPRPRDAATAGTRDADDQPATRDTRRRTRARPTRAGANSQDEKVDLVLWHWQDTRLQSQQEVQEAGDRTFSYLAEYRVQPKKFIRLADDEMRTVNVAPKQSVGRSASDDREYELLGNLDGHRFQDVYVDRHDDRRAQARA